VQLLATLISLILRLFQALLFIRAILSWFPMDPDSMLNRFFVSVTEPMLLPVRTLLYKIPALRRFPFDLSFIVVFLLLQLLIALL
jgi:YggT family protein